MLSRLADVLVPAVGHLAVTTARAPNSPSTASSPRTTPRAPAPPSCSPRCTASRLVRLSWRLPDCGAFRSSGARSPASGTSRSSVATDAQQTPWAEPRTPWSAGARFRCTPRVVSPTARRWGRRGQGPGAFEVGGLDTGDGEAAFDERDDGVVERPCDVAGRPVGGCVPEVQLDACHGVWDLFEKRIDVRERDLGGLGRGHHLTVGRLRMALLHPSPADSMPSAPGAASAIGQLDADRRRPRGAATDSWTRSAPAEAEVMSPLALPRRSAPRPRGAWLPAPR